MRPDCLVLRASDTRFQTKAYVFPVPDTRASPPGTQALTFDAESIRELCAPVRIPWPGRRWLSAADLLGRHEESIRLWIRRGVFEVRYDPASCFNSNGKPIPVVWCASPLDPSANYGAAPDPHWGCAWQRLRDHIPPDFEQTIRRIPILRRYPGFRTLRARGWSWICPSCERLSHRLYLPVRPFSLAEYLARSRATHRPAARVRRRAKFACHFCHDVKYDSLVPKDGWNSFIRSITRGLLSGSEVKRPDDLIVRRKKVPKPRPRMFGPLTPRERDILELLALTPGDRLPAGRSYSSRAPAFTIPRPRRLYRSRRPESGQASAHPTRARPRRRAGKGQAWLLMAQDIASLLNLRVGTVNAHLKKLYRTHRVHRRHDLIRTLDAKGLLPKPERAGFQLRSAG
jgi:hypothetical protein